MLEVLIGEGLKHLGAPFEPEFEDAQDAIAELYQDIWKQKALETRSYRSGDYYRDIKRGSNVALLGGVRMRDVISDVGYGEIIESIGWTTQPPRFPAKKAIEAADPDVEKILGDTAQRVIDRIENG